MSAMATKRKREAEPGDRPTKRVEDGASRVLRAIYASQPTWVDAGQDVQALVEKFMDKSQLDDVMSRHIRAVHDVVATSRFACTRQHGEAIAVIVRELGRRPALAKRVLAESVHSTFFKEIVYWDDFGVHILDACIQLRMANLDDCLTLWERACQRDDITVVRRLRELFQFDAGTFLMKRSATLSKVCAKSPLVFRFLVEDGAVSLEQIRGSRNHCLHYTYEHGSESAVRYLFTTVGLTVEDARSTDNELLRSAARHGDSSMLLFLRSMGLGAADARALNNEALYIATRAGHVDFVRHLFTDFKLEAKDARSGRTLDLACKHGALDIVKFLHTSVGLTTDDLRQSHALIRAMDGDSPEIIQYVGVVGLTTQDALDACIWTVEAFWSRLDVLKCVCSTFGIDARDIPDTAHRSGLSIACSTGRADVIEYLGTTFGMSTEVARSAKVLAIACQHSQVDVLSTLRQAFGVTAEDILGFVRANCQRRGTRSILCKLILKNNVNMLKYLHKECGVGGDEFKPVIIQTAKALAKDFTQVVGMPMFKCLRDDFGISATDIRGDSNRLLRVFLEEQSFEATKAFMSIFGLTTDDLCSCLKSTFGTFGSQFGKINFLRQMHEFGLGVKEFRKSGVLPDIFCTGDGDCLRFCRDTLGVTQSDAIVWFKDHGAKDPPRMFTRVLKVVLDTFKLHTMISLEPDVDD